MTAPTITELEHVAAWLDIKPSELAALRRPPGGGERPNTRLDKLSDDAVLAYMQEMLDECRRALVELERRRAQRGVSHLSPQQRRAQIRAYNGSRR